AVAVLKGPTVEGVVYFSQNAAKGPVSISGTLKNVAPNMDRGFHIHELGDATNGCLSSGSHYNPEGQNHGAPQEEVRHVGDLGNVHSDSTGVVTLDILDSQISLNGPYSIVGRTVVIHEGTDDLGKGKNQDSLKTGNAGGRAGCAVIGVLSIPKAE
ncbi:copper/zinc binding superoxide dismutase, partial [Ramaria rubella]